MDCPSFNNNNNLNNLNNKFASWDIRQLEPKQKSSCIQAKTRTTNITQFRTKAKLFPFSLFSQAKKVARKQGPNDYDCNKLNDDDRACQLILEWSRAPSFGYYLSEKVM